MNCRRQITTWCVFVITCQITHGQYNDQKYDELYEVAPHGYHYKVMEKVVTNYDPNMYTIIPITATPLSLLSHSGGANRGHSGRKGGKSGYNTESGVDGDDTRRKRSFFGYNLPFMTDDESNTTTKTATTTTTTVDGDVKTTDIDSTVLTRGPKTATADTVKTVTNTVANTDSIIADNTGIISSTESENINIVGIDEDLESSMVVAAPYLPLVYKVATFVIPGLPPYQVLLLAVNVATVTTQAFRNYERGESFTSVIAETVPKIAYGALHKRDTGATISNYATNVYNSLKNILYSRFGCYPHYFSHNETTISSPEKHVVSETKSEMLVVTPEIINKEKHIKQLETFNKNKELEKEIIGMKERNINTSSESLNSEDCEEEINKQYKFNSVEVDITLFNKLMEESMKLQPEFIQKTSGEALVKYLNRLKIKLPNPKIDTKKIFQVLISEMDFDDDVTDAKIRELINVLAKTTNYFIAKTLHDKKLLNKQTTN